jgi:glycosyltransferase involved in cell wall biosynthesis
MVQVNQKPKIKNQKSITICCSSFPPEKGGAATRIYNMTVLLRDAGYAVSVLTAMPNYPTGRIFPGYRGRLIHRENVDGINVIRLWMSPSNSGSLLRRGLSLMTHLGSLLFLGSRRLIFKQTDLIIVSSPPLANAALAALLARAGGKKVLVNISDIWPLTAAAMGALNRGMVFRLLQQMERRLYQQAAAFSGQSQEILRHIANDESIRKPAFLYRNLQQNKPGITASRRAEGQPLRIIYAGNLGHAQGMLDLIKKVDFKKAGAELHIYGAGGEGAALQSFLERVHDKSVFLYPSILQKELDSHLGSFHFVLVPLKIPIPGAVPSKLFMAVAAGLPVLFCAGGEGEALVHQHHLGLIATPGNHEELAQRIHEAATMPATDYEQLKANVLATRDKDFSKAMQDEAFMQFIAAVISEHDLASLPATFSAQDNRPQNNL